MKSKLDMLGICTHIRLTNYIQRTFVYKFNFIFGCFFKSKENGPAAQVKWFIELNKKHNISSGFLCSCWRCCEPDALSGNRDENELLCGNGLAKIIKKKVCEMYQEELRESEQLYLKYLELVNE